MGVNDRDVFLAGPWPRQQAVLYRQHQLLSNEQSRIVDQQVQCVRNRALQAVLNGYDAFIRLAGYDGRRHGAD